MRVSREEDRALVLLRAVLFPATFALRDAVARDDPLREDAERLRVPAPRAEREERDEEEVFAFLVLTAIDLPAMQSPYRSGNVLTLARRLHRALRMWGIIPAAGKGSRIQPLAFSKELLPVGSRIDAAGREHPRAVSEYLIERMLLAGVDKFCFVIAPGKSDILEYYGGSIDGAEVCYVVQSQPAGLCDAIFRAHPLIGAEDSLCVGLPDTIWFPAAALSHLASGVLSFLLFPVRHPEFFDAVVSDDAGNVHAIQVKQPGASTSWVWGAFGMPGRVFHQLHSLWRRREPRDEYFGTLVNAWLARGGHAHAARAGEVYVDVGTIRGYREALQALDPISKYDRITHSGSDSQADSGTRILVP